MEKDSLGHIIRRDVDPQLDNLQARRNYKTADNINYLDGHWESNIYYSDVDPGTVTSDLDNDPQKQMYQFGTTTLVNDKSHVYKGASWKDRAYWNVPGTRRYLTDDQSTPYLGFRCAMTRLGSPVGMGY